MAYLLNLFQKSFTVLLASPSKERSKKKLVIFKVFQQQLIGYLAGMEPLS